MIDLTLKDYIKQRKKGNRTNEGYIYENPKNRNQIIKVIEPKATDPEYIIIKKLTIRRLFENSKYIQDLPIAFPRELVAIDKETRGFVADNIKGTELYFALSSKNYTLEEKIDWLKQIGALLRSMSSIRAKNPHLNNFFYNDMHERNFIVNREGIVYGIDPDSFSIQDNIPIDGMYPAYLNNGYTKGFMKYHEFYSTIPNATQITPDENTDLYCYIRIILNFISGKELYVFNPKILEDYLNYLSDKGANRQLLYALSSIHNDNIDNINPDFLLDYIREIYQYSNIHYDETGTLRKILSR